MRKSGGHPHLLNGNPGAIVLFNNLASLPATSFQCPADADEKAKLALKLHHAVNEYAPAGWKSDVDGPKGIQVLNALYVVMSRDKIATRAIFEIIKNQPGY